MSSKKRVFDPEIVILLKDAEQHGYKVVAYVDNGSGGMTHEDIFALRLATAEEKKKGAFSVQLASQHGMHPSRVPLVGLKTRAEKAKDENAVLNKFSGELGWYDAEFDIDDIVVVSEAKLRQLEQLNDFWDVDSRVHSYKPYLPIIGQVCWTYAETAWNQWLDTPIQYANGGMCESVNRIGGDPGALRFLCAKKHCNPSSKEYKFCMVENKIEIDGCFSKFQHCLFQGTTARKPAWRQLP
jgi:hypothetical protein